MARFANSGESGHSPKFNLSKGYEMLLAIVIISTIVIGPFVGAAIPIVTFELIERHARKVAR